MRRMKSGGWKRALAAGMLCVLCAVTPGTVRAEGTGLQEENLLVSAANKSGTLWYSTDADYSFNIRKSPTEVQTTYKDRGYSVVIGKNNTENSFAVQNNNNPGLVRIKNGQVGTVEGFEVQPRFSFTADDAYVKVTYRVYNPTDQAKILDMAVCADIQIDTDDDAPIEQTGTGIIMKEGSGEEGSQFNLYCKNTYGTTGTDTVWFGHYDKRAENCWNDVTEDFSGDSGMALSWQNRTIGAHKSQDFSFLLSVGEPVDPPKIDMQTELTLDYRATEVDVEAKVTDAADRTWQIFYSLDDGAETVLGATIGETDHGTDPIPATDSQQTATGQIPVPEDWEENSVHKLQVWVKNDKFAMSDVKIVYILKKGNEETVVPAQEYTLNFEGGGTEQRILQ